MWYLFSVPDADLAIFMLRIRCWIDVLLLSNTLLFLCHFVHFNDSQCMRFNGLTYGKQPLVWDNDHEQQSLWEGLYVTISSLLNV